MKTYTSDGHICTDIEIFFDGKSKTLQNVVIDTGAVQSILNSEFISDIGIKAEYVDEFMKTHGKGGGCMFTIPSEYVVDVEKALSIIKNEGCVEAYIFGSLFKGNYSSNSDIDIAVKGLKPDRYFKVYGQLLTNLEKSVDLIDLDDESNFSKLLVEKGEMHRVL